MYADRATPGIFLEWAAVSTIAGALERRVWVRTNQGDLFPNLFLLLVAPPGVGKDQALVPMRDLWASTLKLNISPASMTSKGMLEELAAPGAQRSYIEAGNWVNFHSLLIAVNEFGVLMPTHDLQFLSILNDLYSCGPVFEERLRKQEEKFRIERPHIHLVAGTQPNYLDAILPEAAFGMGFMSRMIMIYHGAPTRNELFGSAGFNESLFQRLRHDLIQICDLRGQFRIDKDCMEAIEVWHQTESEHDRPQHSKLIHYNSRRILHILKLIQVFAVARSNELHITLEDFLAAKELLTRTEKLMPEIFKEMSAGSNMDDLEEVYNWCVKISLGGKPIPESHVISYLTNRVPIYQVKPMLETMVASGMLLTIPPKLNIPGQERVFKLGSFNIHEEGK